MQRQNSKNSRPSSMINNQNSSSTSTFPYLSNTNGFSRSLPFSQPQGEAISYNDVCQFRSLKHLPSINNHFDTLRQFINYEGHNILFVFGPSGCGKRLLIEDTLISNQVPYQYATPRYWPNVYDEMVFEDIYAMLDQAINDRNIFSQKVIIFTQFPILPQDNSQQAIKKYKQFRQRAFFFFGQRNNRNKCIFLLNSEIYNSFHVLSQNSEERNLNRLPNVTVMRMEAYGIRQMKAIIEHFVNKYPNYSNIVNSTTNLNQIIAQANGDVRKAFNLIYHKKLQAIQLESNQRGQKRNHRHNKTTAELKQLQKTSIFHMLGKFLYGKRYNLRYNPNSRAKEEKEISAYYTEDELLKEDPKFYFNPVGMLEKSQVPLTVFIEMLQQNYLNRFGKIRDIKNMSQIFCQYDSHLSNALNWHELKVQLQPIMKELLTWGILIYNKNTVRDNKMYKMERSKNKILKELIRKKKQIIHGYYTKTSEGGRYRLKDVIYFAMMSKTMNYRSHFQTLHTKLVDLVTDTRKSTISTQIDSQLNTIQGQDQDIASEASGQLNKILESIMYELRKRERLMALALEDSDLSDIDSD